MRRLSEKGSPGEQRRVLQLNDSDVCFGKVTAFWLSQVAYHLIIVNSHVLIELMSLGLGLSQYGTSVVDPYPFQLNVKS